jgi:predicted O-linked N-acetylglucosamine transferase (SPINDLY family)
MALKKIGRNEACPCGSGKKYKVCCYQQQQTNNLESRASQTVEISTTELFAQGLQHHKAGELAQAQVFYEQVLQINPAHADALHHLGLVLHHAGKNSQAIDLIKQAIAIAPTFAAYNNLANIFKTEHRTAEAIEHFQTAIALKPDYAEAFNNLGVVYKEQNNFDVAIAHYQKAIALNPQFAGAFLNLGTALKEGNNLEGAIACYQKAIALQPGYAEAYNGLASAFNKQNKLEEAILTYQKAIALNPHSAEAFSNLGNIFNKQKKLTDAIACYEKALALKPQSAEALGSLFHARQHCCDWTDFQLSQQKVVQAVNAGQEGYKPLSFLAVSDSGQAQKQCALTFAKKNYPTAKQTPQKSNYQHSKICIAYVSADFREHAVSILMAELFELHDKNRFEVFAISLQPETTTSLGQRVKNAFTQFIDVTDKSDVEVAQLIESLEIDIAVDLMGFTANSRTAIFAYRPAPIQINYLGYPGTMGVDYMDYIVADAYLIPPGLQHYYSEKIIYLPDCFQVNDSKRFVPTQIPTRAELGLPQNSFVFCALNGSYKFTPLFFEVWMNLLKAVPDSVLWLFADTPMVENHLRHEAVKRGVAVERLIFAKKVVYQSYLANYPLADLFLDTLPFNGGTTVSDALWMGLPVLTCSGEAFAARMAGSLLNALGLPELITDNLRDYENKAIQLATTPNLLADIRAKLAEHKKTYPLFNPAIFCQHLESAYTTIWERHQRDEPPISFAVSASASNIAAPVVSLPALFNTAQQQRNAGNFAQAEAIFRQVLAQQPNHAEALHWLGITYYQTGKNAAAIELIKKSIALNPESSIYYCNFGVVLSAQKQIAAAIAAYQQSLRLKPDNASALYNLGNAYTDVCQFDAAIQCYQHALSLNPNNLGACLNLGEAYRLSGKLSQAIDCYQKILLTQPQHIDTLFNLAFALETQGKETEAKVYYEKVLTHNPNYAKALDALFSMDHQRCDWKAYHERVTRISQIVKKAEQQYRPFGFLHVSDNAALQYQCTQTYTKLQYPAAPALWKGEIYQHPKIRLAYLSGDFCDHAVSRLLVSLWEEHDRNRFEVFALSFCPADNNSELGLRVVTAFDQFIDISTKSDEEVALLIQYLEIDIAVDLMGFTAKNRTHIFSFKAVPIQINYLGYPATMGANYIDYIFADAYLIPSEYQHYYAEKVIYLPECFQANDSQRLVPEITKTRAEVGLPETGFVFCSFNSSYKFTPPFFQVWMNLLTAVPDSVLWLFAGDDVVQNNLRNEAVRYGVAVERLVFTKKVSYDAYLANYQLADLFLDTLPFNGGTTVSDALWMKLPVLTCSGEAFAARMAGSLLHAIGLPELIAHNLLDYQEKAVKLATNPILLAEIKEKLLQNRKTHPLFNAERFRYHIELAYITMWEKQQRGEAAQSFQVISLP